MCLAGPCRRCSRFLSEALGGPYEPDAPAHPSALYSAGFPSREADLSSASHVTAATDEQFPQDLQIRHDTDSMLLTKRPRRRRGEVPDVKSTQNISPAVRAAFDSPSGLCRAADFSWGLRDWCMPDDAAPRTHERCGTGGRGVPVVIARLRPCFDCLCCENCSCLLLRF